MIKTPIRDEVNEFDRYFKTMPAYVYARGDEQALQERALDVLKVIASDLDVKTYILQSQLTVLEAIKDLLVILAERR